MIIRVNVQGSYTMFEAAGDKLFLFCSSGSVAGYTVCEGRTLTPPYAPLDLDHPLLAIDPYVLSKVLSEGLASGRLCPVQYVSRCPAYGLRRLSRDGAETDRSCRGLSQSSRIVRGKPLRRRWRSVAPLHRSARSLTRLLARDRLADETRRLRAFLSLCSSDTIARANARSAETLSGDNVQIRDPDVYLRESFAPLFDLKHTADRLGFIAEYDQRHLIPGQTSAKIGN